MKKILLILLIIASTVTYSLDVNVIDIIYNKAYEMDIDPNLIIALGKVESKLENVIGDNHLNNKAYGYFQLRQPAVDEVNNRYGTNKVKKASELLERPDLQVEYCILFIQHLKSITNNEEKAIMAYNAGIGGAKKGKGKNYLTKVMNEYENILKSILGGMYEKR